MRCVDCGSEFTPLPQYPKQIRCSQCVWHHITAPECPPDCQFCHPSSAHSRFDGPLTLLSNVAGVIAALALATTIAWVLLQALHLGGVL